MPNPAIPDGKTSASSLTDETLASLDSDHSKVATLSTRDKYALTERLMAGEAETPLPDPAPDGPEKTPDPVETEPPSATPEGDPETQTEEAKADESAQPVRKDRRYWKEKFQEAEAERNREKQRREAAQRRLEALEKVETEAKAVKAEKALDPYDDNDLRGYADRMARLEKELSLLRETNKQGAKKELEEAEAKFRQRDEETIFTAIGRLQSEFDDLRTEHPFEKLNADYAQWLDRLVDLSGFKDRAKDATLPELRSMARELYTEDEDFRREAIAKRAKPPKELDKIETILTVHEKRTKDGGGYRANYLDLLAERGVLPEVISKRERAAALKASQQTVDAMTRGNKGVPQLSPQDGSSSFPTQAPAEKMQAWLKDLQTRVARGHRMSGDEKAQAMSYMELMSTGD